MKRIAKWAAVALVATSGSAIAQNVPQDIPPGHWAYEAVEELANRGIVLGYPDGRFLGNRTLTRYEMAALLQRILRRLEDRVDERVKEATPDAPAATPAPAGVTPEELAEVRRLVDEFKVELSVMGTNMEKVNQMMTDLETVRGNVENLQAQVEGLAEGAKLAETEIANLRRTRLSGYLQARYESGGGVFRQGQRPEDRFFIRRGRVKLTHTGEVGDMVLSWDAANSNTTGFFNRVEVRDAYVTWNLGLPQDDRENTGFWFGQFNVPFGYEIERSSSVREFPERSLAENALFPGERDRGVKFTYGLKGITFDASLLNGGGINQTPADDNFKDVSARVRGALSSIWDLGVSGYWGKARGLTAAVAAVPARAATPGTLVFNQDTNNDGRIDQTDTPTFVPGTAAAPAVAAQAALPFESDRTRLGVDTQIYILGGALRGEAYWGRQPVSAPTTNPVPAVRDVPVFGWYGQYTFDLNPRNQLGIRFDTYDPNRDAPNDATSRWNAVWNHFVGTNLRLTTSYEWFPKIPALAAPAVNTDKGRWTLQAQHSF